MKSPRLVAVFPVVLFSLLAMLLRPAVQLGAVEPGEPGWYRSNALAMPIEPISEQETGEHEYTLFVEREHLSETRRLYREGAEVQETVREFSEDGTLVSQEDRENGRLHSRREFDEEGRLEAEYEYEDGSLVTVDFFSYRDGRLFERRREDGDGEELFVERYRYTSDGLVRRVERMFSTDNGSGSSEFLYSGGELREEWHERDNASVLVRYDRFGRLSRTEERRDDVLVLSERLFYREGDDNRDAPPERSERREPERGLRTETVYDESGRAVTERRYEDDERIEEREFQYEDDLLVLEVIRDDEGEQQRHYEYDDDGERVSEERTRDGVTERRIEFDGERRTEHRYVDGDLALTIEFDGEDRVREQVIRDGEVVREREF